MKERIKCPTAIQKVALNSNSVLINEVKGVLRHNIQY